jgi:tripartite-type tricarboxylate transporter receptor subunit TctC
VVVNRPGASGAIAAVSVAKAAPDGYTIFLVNSQHTTNPALRNDLPYDTVKDFCGIALFADAPSMITVHPGLNIRTLKELIAYAKANPGKLNYGTSGVGTTTHIAGALFAARTGINIVPVPYKGPEITADILSGRLDLMFVPVAFPMQYVREGKLVALAVTSREPLRTPIEVPTVEAAAGLPGFEYGTYYGIIGPANMPMPIREQLSREFRQVILDGEVKARLASLAVQPRDLGPTEFDAFIKSDIERVNELVKSMGPQKN